MFPAMCNVLHWKYILFSMSLQVPFPQSIAQFSLSSFELLDDPTLTITFWRNEPLRTDLGNPPKVNTERWWSCFSVTSPSQARAVLCVKIFCSTTAELPEGAFHFFSARSYITWQTPKIIATTLHWIEVCHPCQEPWLHQTHRTLFHPFAKVMLWSEFTETSCILYNYAIHFQNISR